MIRAKKVAKRGLSLLLTLAMLLSVVSFQAFAEEPATVAKSDLLIKQYGTELTAEEQAVVKELVEGTYSYTLPDAQNGDGLIVITDKATTNPKIEAKTEGVWVPVSATVKVDGEEAPRTLTLDADGKAEFTNEELKPYAVTVTYRYAETISAEEAAAVAAAFRAPAQLKNGLDQMKFLNDYVVDSLNELAGYLPTLHEYDPELHGDISINNEEFNEAVRTLYAQYEANGGYLNLPVLLANGQKEESGKPMPDVSLANLLANGGEIYASTADTQDIISNWLGSRVWTNETLMKFDAMESAYTVLNNLVNNLKKAADAAFAPEADVVALFEGKDLAKLETLIKAVSAEQKSFEVGTSLTVAEQLVTANVGQTAILVKIEAKVINGENELVAAEPAFAPGEVTLPVGATKAQIEAAIKEAGFEATALGQWEENFQVNETNYDKTVSELPETLGEETVTYTVSFEPKYFDVTIAGETEQYRYGWTLTLPECETEGRAYDYSVDGVAYFQGETIRVTKALNITRTEGPAYQVLELDALAAKATNTGLNDAAKAILNNPAVVTKSVKLRVPEGDLAKAALEGGVYTVTANPYNASIAGKSWLPAVAKIDGVEDAVFAEGANSVTLSRIDFELATVDYVLALPDSALGNGIATVIALPTTLKAEAAAQKEGLANLTATEIMNDLGSLNKEKLQKLRTGVVNFVHDEAIVKGVMAIIDECVAPNNSLILYNYLNEYNNQGLAYYYQFSGNINDQIAKLTVNLKPIMDNKAGFKQDLIDSRELTDAEIEDYLSRFDRIYAALTAADAALEAAPINAAINTASPALSELVAALDAEIVTGEAPAELELTEEVPVDVQGRFILTVAVENALTGKKESKRFVFASVGEENPTATVDTAAVNKWIADIAAAFEDADLFTKGGDAVPATLTANTNITVTYNPTQFQVKLNGEDWAGVTVALGSLTIELPVHEKDPSFRYDYKVNGVAVEGSTATFTKDDLRSGNLNVTREEVNVTEQRTLDVVDKINKAIVENGMTATVGGAECGVATLLLDKTGDNKSLVLRLTPSKNLNKKAVFSAIADTLSGSGLYIGIEGEPFWDPDSTDGSLYPQSAVDMMLNSGFGMKTILDVIKTNGDIVEMNASTLGTANAREAASTDANINDYDVYAEDTLGGLLIKATIQVGMNSGATEDITLYITLEDFDTRTDTLKSLRKNVNKLYQYIDAQLIDGNAKLTLKDGPAYKAYITAAAAAGYSDISDIYNIDSNGLAEFAFQVIDQLIQDEEITLETYENTIGEIVDIGDYDVGRFSNYYDYAKKAYSKILAQTTVDDNERPEPGDNPSVWKLTTDVVAVLQSQSRYDTHSVEEVLGEDTVKYGAALELPDVEYVAVVIVPETNKRNKISFPKDGELSAVLAENNKDAVVILLSDCTEVVEINKNVALDLNGKKLAGVKVGASSNHAVIVDSTLDNRGQVGTVEGTSALKITGGTFPSADVTAYLPNDYIKDGNNVVRNKLYFLTVDDSDNTITVNIDPDRITLYGFPSPKALAVELAFDLGVNYYGAASMTVNGNELYGTDFENDRVTDLIDWLINITEEDANEVIDYFHMDGINAFIAEVIGVATNFTNIAANVDGELATFEFTYNTWAFDVHRCERRNELDFDVLANEQNSKSGKIVFKFADSDEYDLTKYADAKAEIKDLAQHLADVTTLNACGLTLDKPTYHNKTLTLQGTGKTDVVFDLRDDPSYALAFGVIFAAGVKDTAKAEAVKDGIKAYYASGSMKDLKAAIEALGNDEVLDAAAELHRADGEDLFEKLVEKAGLTGVIDDHTIELARTYRAWLVSFAAADRLSGITGGGKKIGAYETEYGVYEIEKTGSVNRSKTIKRWTVDGTGIVETGHMTLKLFRQTPVIYTIQDVDTTGDILAWKVIDSYPDKAQSVSTAAGTDGILYIDLITDKEIDFFPCVGFITPDDLKAALTDVLYDGDVLEMEIEGAVTDEYTGTTEVVPTGAKVTLRAWYNDDPDNIVEAVYYIVNLGDTNCNGFTDSGDAVLIKDHYEKEGGVLSGYALLAGNVNQQGDGEPGDLSIDGIDSGDAVRVKIKYENPSKYPPSALN